MRAIEQNPKLTQRELTKALGVSLGRAYNCSDVLIDKGLVKTGNYSHNQKKLDCTNLSTLKDIKSKTLLTTLFLQRKMAEYEQLKHKIELASVINMRKLEGVIWPYLGKYQMLTQLLFIHSSRRGRQEKHKRIFGSMGTNGIRVKIHYMPMYKQPDCKKL